MLNKTSKPNCKVFMEHLNSREDIKLSKEDQTIYCNDRKIASFYLGKEAKDRLGLINTKYVKEDSDRIVFKSHVLHTMYEQSLIEIADLINRYGKW